MAAGDRFIDSNRGSDANHGSTSAAPWQNLSKIIGSGSYTTSAGDTIYLAADSEWNIAFTSATTFLLGNGTGYRGTLGNPVTITRYAPLSQTLSDVYPIIQATYPFTSMSWNYNTTAGLWQSTTTGNAWFNSKNSVIGLSAASNLFAAQATNATTAASAGIGWYYVDGASNATLSLHSGSSTDSPATVWPNGWMSPDGRSYPYLYDNAAGTPAGTYLTINGIKWRYSVGIKLAPTPSLGNCVGFTMIGCKSYQGRLIAANLTHTTYVMSVNIMGNILDDVIPTMGIHVNGSQSSSYISNNIINTAGGRPGRMQGAIYIQGYGTYPAVSVIGNKGYDCAAEFSNTTFSGGLSGADGSFIYNENGAGQNYFTRNLAVRCTQAFQDNSGQPSVWDNNVTFNCGSAFSLSDASANGSSDYAITNNKMLNCWPRTKFYYGSYSWTKGVINDYAYDLNLEITGNSITFDPSYPYDAKAIYLTPNASTKSRQVSGNSIGPGAWTDVSETTVAASVYDVNNMVYVTRVGPSGYVSSNALASVPTTR